MREKFDRCGESIELDNGEHVSPCSLEKGHSGDHEGWCLGSRFVWRTMSGQCAECGGECGECSCMKNDEAEKAAEKHGTLYYFDKDGNPKEGGLNVQKSASFLAGVEWERKRKGELVWLDPAEVSDPLNRMLKHRRVFKDNDGSPTSEAYEPYYLVSADANKKVPK